MGVVSFEFSNPQVQNADCRLQITILLVLSIPRLEWNIYFMKSRLTLNNINHMEKKNMAAYQIISKQTPIEN